MLDYYELARIWSQRNVDMNAGHSGRNDWAFSNLGQISHVRDYECRPNGGEPIKGDRHTFYELLPNEQGHEVVLHSFILPSEEGGCQFPLKMEGVWPYPKNWEQLEGCMLRQYTPLHRTRKKVTLLGFIGMLYPSDYPNRSTEIEWFSKRIGTLLTGKIPPLVLREYKTCAEITTAYYEFDRWSHSCMTGDESQYTEFWGTNGKQCRLVELRVEDGDDPVARCLVFRPMESTLTSKAPDDADLGEGWYYGRIYGSTRNVVMSTTRCVEVAIAHLESIGIKSVDLRPAGVVPLTVTEYSPYIDKGVVFWSSSNDTAVWASCENDTVTRWRRLNDGVRCLESFTDGSGFGNTRFDSVCSCCDSQYDSEEGGAYVEDYGSVCDCCLESSDRFVLDMNGDWRDSDNCYRFVSKFFSQYSHNAADRGCSYEDALFVNSGSRRINLFRQGIRHVVVLEEVEYHDGETIYCPDDETEELEDGTTVWRYDPDLVTVSRKLIWDSVLMKIFIEDIEATPALKQGCVKVGEEWMIDGTTLRLDQIDGFRFQTVAFGDRLTIVAYKDSDPLINRWYKYGNHTVGVNTMLNNLVVYSSITRYIAIPDLPANAPVVGSTHNGDGMPLSVRVNNCPIRIDSMVQRRPFTFNSLEVRTGKDVDGRWYYGNVNGYAMYDTSGIAVAMSWEVAHTGGSVGGTPRFNLYDHNGNKCAGECYAAGSIIAGRLCVLIDDYNKIKAVGIQTGNNIKFVIPSSLREDLRSMISDYNDAILHPASTLVRLIETLDNYNNSDSTVNNHPVLGASYNLVNKETA